MALYALPAPPTARETQAMNMAQRRIGVLKNALQFWTDCTETSGQGEFDFPVGGSGAATINTSDGGGYWNLTSGANGFVGARLASQAQALTRTATGRWHLAVRMKITSTPDALTVWQCGTFGNYVAVLGATSTTKYVGRIGATSITSAVSIDTAFHTFELWGNASATWFAVDGEGPVSGAATTPTSSYPFCQAWNQTTGAQVDGVVDYLHFYSERDL